MEREQWAASLRGRNKVFSYCLTHSIGCLVTTHRFGDFIPLNLGGGEFVLDGYVSGALSDVRLESGLLLLGPLTVGGKIADVPTE